MTEREQMQLGLDGIYLLGCALGKTIPGRQMLSSWEHIYAFCKFHSITATVAPVVEHTDCPEEIKDKFRQQLGRSIRKNVLLDAESSQICQFLVEIGCWYLPLKGSILQRFYPSFGMRQMSDHDILIDPDFQEQVHRYMLDRGYEAAKIHLAVENSYRKKPVYNIEIHTGLFGLESADVFSDYYSNPVSLFRSWESRTFKRELRPEEFYIYLIAHAYKHAAASGIGFRLLADIWVCRNAMGILDETLVTHGLRRLGIAEFETVCRSLASKLLDEPDSPGVLTVQENDTLMRLLRSGTHGTEATKMENLIQNNRVGGKLGYVLARVFPPVSVLAPRYPVVTEHRWLLPFVWLYRIAVSLFTRPMALIREFITLARKK